ncbi:MAG TPA: carboxyl transferase domain-containing protein [Solirubrobacteraceae bacterium]|nr:carboxyl transferase domain-containing protein [Solirubrobacteraceae bacterium]
MPPPVELEVSAPFAGVVVAVEHTPGAAVQAGAVLVVLEAMKMEHEVLAESDGVVRRVEVAAGDAIEAGDLLVVLTAHDRAVNDEAREGEPRADLELGGTRKEWASSDPKFGGARKMGPDVDAEFEGARKGGPRADVESDAVVRADLAAVRARHELGLDVARPEAIERRHARGRRTARENLAELVDAGSYVEYGPLLFAAQERRRSKQELIEKAPADGLVAGVAAVEGNPCVAMSYDYTVLAGTQGMRGHLKKDRLFELAERRRLPVVLFAEGGGGRPGDVDFPIVAGLDCRAFHLFGRLSGLVPLVGIASGYCFAGNAALLGCCDVVIATEDSSIGMGGPAMIEGGGLGVYEPSEVGPIDVQHANGVVDLRVADDRAAVAVAKRYFHGPVAQRATLGQSSPDESAPDEPASGRSAPDESARGWAAPDQSLLRNIVPEQRKRAYEVRKVLHGLCDEDSVLELRDGFGAGMVTALARIEGEPLGVVANDPSHLGGAIDADAADKAARFLQLCDAFGLPVLFLCDTPGFMVGADAERTATVRHFSRLFVTGANLEIPFGTIVLRKGYGLGAQAMAGGSFKAPLFCVGWPTSEFGGMGLEGAVRLGMRRELEEIEDAEERERIFQATVAAAYEHGEGLNMAAYGEIDDVIDPADSRRWIATLFDPPPADWRTWAGKRRPNVDTW